MRKNSSSLPSAAMVVALVALVVALGGTGYATTHLGARGAASSTHPTKAQTKVFKELAKKVTVANAANAKALDHAAASAYQRSSKLMFATINTGVHPTIARGRGATGVKLLDPPTGGEYDVRFDRPIGNCTWVATEGPGSASPADAQFAVVRADNITTHPNTVLVILYDGFSDNETVGQGFHIIVACP
jgi:hypothetical protein